jgi:hypothetical protein
LDESSTTVFNDFVNPENVATSLTALQDTIGKVGHAKKFKPTSATSQFITIPDNDQMEWSVADNFSIAMWVYSYGKSSFAGNDDNQVLFARFETGRARIIAGFDVSAGNFYPRFRLTEGAGVDEDVSALTLPSPLSIKSWHHLVFVYQADGVWGHHYLRIYVDGELPTGGQNDNWFTSDHNFYMNSPISVGWYPEDISNKYPFNGKMDDLLVFDKALTAGEVQSIYQDGQNGLAHCKAGNYAPLFTNEFISSVDEDDQYSLTVTYNDYDGDPVTLSDSVLPGWLSLNAGTGLLQGTPTNDDVGTNEVILKISDGDISISKSFNITVNNTNDPPYITSSSVNSVDEDQLYSYVIAYDDDDIGDVLTLSATAPDWLFLNTGTHTLSGTPTNAVLGTNDYVDFDIKVKVTDAAGDSAVQNYTLRVTNVNDPPTILGQNTITTPGSTAIQLDVETVFSEGHIVDVDDVYPDDFTLTIQSGENYLLGANNTITPVDGFRGNLNVSAMLSDGEEVLPYTILVSVANNAPVITSSPATSIDLDGTPYVYNITADDLDQDDELVYAGDLVPSWLSFDPATQILSGTPTEPGNYDVILSVTDGYSTVSQPFAIQVIPVGIEDQDASALRIYPMPANNVLYVEYSNTFHDGIFEIMDMKGNVILQKEFESFEGRMDIDISNYKAGMYIYRVTFDNHVYTGKIIVE